MLLCKILRREIPGFDSFAAFTIFLLATPSPSLKLQHGIIGLPGWETNF